ncbi:hypothetical protein DFS34DRAFT_695685 [Phlyctochytrium arcticum]|nr:hypothetical protein DFS34DRAFT_695685 [Phlyctochytrium arcticum]
MLFRLTTFGSAPFGGLSRRSFDHLFSHQAIHDLTLRASQAPALRLLNGQRPYASGAMMSDNDPIVLETEKERLLKGRVVTTIPDAPGWDEKLASYAEAVVKAERTTVDTTHVDNLQDESVQILHKERMSYEDDSIDLRTDFKAKDAHHPKPRSQH